MEEADLNGESRGKRRKKNTDCPETAGSPPHGVVIWDIDDTIVVIQASLKLHRNLHQLELVKSVKDYLTAYLDKEFYFCDTLHMNVVERLLDWEKETPIPVEADPQKREQAEEQNSKKPPLPTLGNEIIANGSAYSTFLKSHYRTFQNEKIQSPPGTPKNLDKQTAVCDDDKPKDKGFNIDHIYQRLPPGWRKIFNAMERKTLFWTEQAREVLSHLKKNNVRNMIVTASEIAPAVAKLIMWGLFEFFDIDDIYSSAKKPKTRVFQHLLEDLCADNHPPPQFVGKCSQNGKRDHCYFIIAQLSILICKMVNIPYFRILLPLSYT